jgi:hypothetical protein
MTGLLAFALGLNAQTPSPYVSRAINTIRAAELKGDLSFLASDLLQGRYTPSPGLDIAAEFIASQFRAAGLQPGGNSEYFQTADMITRTLPKVTTPLTIKSGDQTLSIEPAQIQVIKVSEAAAINDAPVLKVMERNPEKLKGLDLEGKVVLVPSIDYLSIPADERMSVALASRAFDKAVGASKALLEVSVTTKGRRFPAASFLYAEDAAARPLIQVESAELAAAINAPAALTLSVQIPAPDDQKATVKNVIGVLRGSDPALKSTAVLVTAHYDHIGTTETAGNLAESKPTGSDKIFNGANDDGSGTVSVIEIARALAHLHPRRSIVFITFFGEERGLLGSTYYGRHPLFPISKTVADINLEQVGRTDSSEGPEIANASITGYDYSDVTKYLEDAGKATGITIYKDAAGSDQYFVRSDNAALAEQGVPAHTLTTAFEYPDYHAVGDEWQKIDYENMAKVDRTVALAVLNIANTAKAPAWNAENPKTAPFRQAQKKNQ